MSRRRLRDRRPDRSSDGNRADRSHREFDDCRHRSGLATARWDTREVGPEALQDIEKIGFEKYIRTHIDNDHMAYNPDYYRDHREVAASLAEALWSGQSTVDLYHIHEQARLSWDTLAEAPRVKVPTLVLCGAEDGVERRGSTPAATAKMLAPLIPGAELALIPKTRHMTFWDGDGALIALQGFLARHPIRTH